MGGRRAGELCGWLRFPNHCHSSVSHLICIALSAKRPHKGRQPPPPQTPCVTFRLVAPLRGPGRSPVLPFACCVGSLHSVSRCGRCSCWCFRVRGAQWLVCWGCAGCGGMCRLHVSGAQKLAY